MNRNEQFRRNHRLFEIFMKEALREPALVEAVPDKADVIMLPDNDPELRLENLRLAKQLEKEGRQPVVVEVRLVPETRTVLVPHVEVVPPAQAAAR